MKKVLVAGTALMLVGAAAAQAEAGVNISGDARVSYIGKDTLATGGYDDFFESRVGLNFEGKAAADKVTANARLYFDGNGFEDDVPWNGQQRTELSVDYAYLTAPMGDWTIKAGRINSDYSKFFSWNIRPTRLVATYKQGNLSVTPFVGVRAEGSSNTDDWNDNDYMEYGFVVKTKLQSAWNLAGYVRYDDDQRTRDGRDGQGITGNPVTGFQLVNTYVETPHNDRSGVIADVFLNNEGANCDFGFHAELAYKAADVQNTQDDGLGGYVMLSKQMSAQFTPALVAGATQNGFIADNDFGFVMVGGELSTQLLQVGEGFGNNADLLFGAFVANYKASDRLTLTGNLLYADFSNDPLENAIELSGIAGYALNESTTLTYKAGYLTASATPADPNDSFAHLLRLNISF